MSRICALLSIIPYVSRILNHQMFLLTSKQYYLKEGVPQLAMSMHGIATIPFVELLDKWFTVQMWYADDGKAVGSLDNLIKNF